MAVMKAVTLALLCAVAVTNAQSSCISPSGRIQPSVASGYSLQVVATGLAKPRGLTFDSQGHLLVVQQGSGSLTSYTIDESNGCTTLGNNATVVDVGLNLNHGLWVNGTTLYASNVNSVYSWTYDPNARTVSNQEELVNGMANSDHGTRTLLLPESAPGMLVITRGSGGNLDINSTTIEGGTAQVRAFNLNNRTGIYDWLDGQLLAWGVRNEVGIAEHPATGGIWGVENSADQITRNGVDVSNNNPGEELNFFGYLNSTPYANQGANFGYPWCLAAYNLTELPNSSDLTIGEQFAFDTASTLDNENRTDEYCSQQAAPRLVFQAHMAPLDIKFNNSATEAWISFHGSWDREVPVGYKLSVVRFGENGEPSDQPDSLTAVTDIVSNTNLSACPANCFRPAGLAVDNRGRIFMTSDSSGEIYLVTRNSTSNGTSGTSTSASPSATASASSASTYGIYPTGFGAVCVLLLFLLF
ncbi:hypothetical protein LTS08_002478 [Lithohypha guttulata]|nr:hypothetical protein LTS08_002478 [Lithohypha guttulata]